MLLADAAPGWQELGFNPRHVAFQGLPAPHGGEKTSSTQHHLFPVPGPTTQAQPCLYAQPLGLPFKSRMGGFLPHSFAFVP